jgi:PAS domain S-box-containing protein
MPTRPLADFLPEPLLIVRRDAIVEHVNRAFTDAFGWRNGDVAGRALFELVTNPRPEVQEFLRHCAATSSRLFGALVIRHREGVAVPCRLEGARLRQPPGRDDLIVLRAIKKESAVAQFVDLTQKIGDLSAEVSRRRRAERAASDALASERRLRDRLTALADGSGLMLSKPTLAELLPAIGEFATTLIAADGYAVWQSSSKGREWRTVWQRGLSAQFANRIEEPTDPAVLQQLNQPSYVDDVGRAPWPGVRAAAYASEGIQSLVVIPLRVGTVARATLVAYHRRRVDISEDDRRVAAALGNFASSAVASTLLHESEAARRAAVHRAAARTEFLARASAALASSLDYEATLRTVAQLAVPEIADWCAVDIAEGAELKRLAVAHQNPEKVQLALELQARYPADPHSPYGATHVLRTGNATFMARIPEPLIAASAQNAEHLTLMRSLGMTSYMCVPLLSRGRTLGVLTFVSAESGREYAEEDVRFAEDLASRAALAVENARAYEEIRRANRVKDEFLATLSHELRTPLNAVLGYARMMRSGMLDDEKRARALEVLERNAVSLNQIVEEVLDVSRIVAGKIRLNVQPIDLAVVLHDASATVKPAADAKGVHLYTQIEPARHRIHGDPDRLQQVVWNLLSNAVKFTPRGGHVHVELIHTGSQAVVRVTDNGVGIKPELLRHLFEPFTQGDSSFSRDTGGLGLGLAIARHIVEMHGGTIHVESEGDGCGATFTVRLPVAAVLVESRPLVTEDTRPQAATQPRIDQDLTGIHVLVVEDDPDARMLLYDVLEAAGATVVTADSASSALRVLEAADTPNVLISDIGMPAMDGLELITRIRASSRQEVRGMPAVALTAYARSEDRLRALEHGYQLHLAKPIRPEEVVAAIRELAPRPA